ncbi:hypothetical protein I79_009432 [Cricetulus griseus]|uniref:Uncharacterized protein n=1 Tax=Cricetulus griseus TaxID=10029 RepID=G3HFR8_CRIGR|nr:hypothetical protein I79_009432 [Cricetulus griseus]
MGSSHTCLFASNSSPFIRMAALSKGQTLDGDLEVQRDKMKLPLVEVILHDKREVPLTPYRVTRERRAGSPLTQVA